MLDEVPRVRKEMGYPPLVTPTSQIVGTQATLNVLTGERYKVITTETKNYFLGLYGRAPGPVDHDIMARAIGDDHPIKTRPADRLEPELEAARKDLPDSAASVEDQLSFTLFPSIARDFFEAREKGDLALEPLEIFSASGSAAATELHLAPAEFNVTVHGETYHIEVSGSGRKVDGRKPYYIRVNDKLEEVSLRTNPGNPRRRAGNSRCRQQRQTETTQAIQAGRCGAADARPRRQSARRDQCQSQSRSPPPDYRSHEDGKPGPGHRSMGPSRPSWSLKATM